MIINNTIPKQLRLDAEDSSSGFDDREIFLE